MNGKGDAGPLRSAPLQYNRLLLLGFVDGEVLDDEERLINCGRRPRR